MKHLLEINQLQIGFYHNVKTELMKDSKPVLNEVVDGLNLYVDEGEIIGLVGESGSGKSMTSLSIMNLLNKEAVIMGGEILYEGENLLTMEEEKYRHLMGTEISMIFQEPMTSLNPVLKIGFQVEEVLKIHYKTPKDQRRERGLQALLEAGFPEPEGVYNKYPHELSGGMRQRVMIAMAMICGPKLLIADEPTTALDVSIQDKVLKLIKRLVQKHNTAVIFVSHDLAVIQSLCSRAYVLNEGKVVEEGEVKKLFDHPNHEYTKKLIGAIPSMTNQVKEYPMQEKCILAATNVKAFYEEKRKHRKEILKGVSLNLYEGEILGIVGESGSGKSTLAKVIVGLNKNYSGQINTYGSKPQMVFQDPYGSLNPSKKIGWLLEEPLKLVNGYSKAERKKRVEEIIEQVGLSKEHLKRYPSQLSGGQRQRIAIAMTLIRNEKLVILDEPVSALDVTIQAQIMKLLLELREKFHLSYLFISHDLNVVYKMCDRVLVMYEGEIVEEGYVHEVYHNPKHEYTKTLLGDRVG